MHSPVVRPSLYLRKLPAKASRKFGELCANGRCASKGTKYLRIKFKQLLRLFGTLMTYRHRRCVSLFHDYRKPNRWSTPKKLYRIPRKKASVSVSMATILDGDSAFGDQ